MRRFALVGSAAALALTAGVALAQRAPVRTLRAGAATASTDAGAGATDAARSPAETARRALVAARVGSTEITVGELEDMLNEAPAPVRQAYADPARRREFLQNMVHTILLAEEAKRRGLDRAPEVASAIRRILAQRVQQSAVIEAIGLDAIPEADVTAYYNAHTELFHQPEKRRGTVIFLPDRAAADAVAQQARAARGDMHRIQEIVRDRTMDTTTRTREGDLGYFRREQPPRTPNDGAPVDPAVADAAFTLARETDVSAPVRAANGQWAVVVLTGIRPGFDRALNDPGVSASIRGTLVRERRSQREHSLLEEIRARVQPEVHEDRLDQLRLPTAELGNVPAFEPAPRRPPTPGASPLPSAPAGASAPSVPPVTGEAHDHAH